MAIITYTSRGRLETIPGAIIACPICSNKMTVQKAFKIKKHQPDEYWCTQGVCEDGCKNKDAANRRNHPHHQQNDPYFIVGDDLTDLARVAYLQRSLVK